MRRARLRAEVGADDATRRLEDELGAAPAPRADRRQQPERDRRAVPPAVRRVVALEGGGGDLQSHPHEEADAALDGKKGLQQAGAVHHTEEEDGEHVEEEVAHARAHRFEGAVPDVDARGERVAEGGGDEVDQRRGEERRPGVELVADGLGRLDVGQVVDEPHQPHGHHDGGRLQEGRREEMAPARALQHWQLQPRRVVRRRRHEPAEAEAVADGRERDADAERDEAAGQVEGELDLPRVKDEHQQHRHERGARRGEDLGDEAHRDEGERDARDRGEHRGALRRRGGAGASESQTGRREPACRSARFELVLERP